MKQVEAHEYEPRGRPPPRQRMEVLGAIRPKRDDLAIEQHAPADELGRRLTKVTPHRREILPPAADEPYVPVIDAGEAAPSHFGSIAHSSRSTGMSRPLRASIGETQVGSLCAMRPHHAEISCKRPAGEPLDRSQLQLPRALSRAPRFLVPAGGSQPRMGGKPSIARATCRSSVELVATHASRSMPEVA